MKFTLHKSDRSIEVTDLPRLVDGIVSADELTVSVNYTGRSSCRKGITLDNAVMPLIAAAPMMLEALQECAAALRTAKAYHKGRAPWVETDDCALVAAEAAIEKARGY